jgi:hypothetical protein
MSTSIDTAFIKQYESEVHLAYQRMGTVLRSTVRSKGPITGLSTTFQKAGKGEAVTKTRHGDITPMNASHSNVECIMSDWYAGDWVDKLDEVKTNIDERSIVAMTGAYALGRRTDLLITTAMAGATGSVGDYSTGFTRKLALDAFEYLNSRDVPDDGQRFGVLSAHAWGEALRIDEFSRSEYVGTSGLPWTEGPRGRRWLGINWFMFTGLPLADTDNRDCYVYHRTAIGHGYGAEITADITWHGDKASHFVNHMMSQGAVLIDGEGICEVRVDDDANYS